MWDARRVFALAVGRVFTGSIIGKQTDIATGNGGGDCGYEFEVGRTYLVYASRDTAGILSTHLCTRTKLLDDAKDDLTYLEHIPGERTGAPVYGRITYWDLPAGAAVASRQPVRDAVVELDGEGRHYRAAVDEQGRFKFNAIPPGTYQRIVRTAMPGAFDMREIPIVVNDARGCAQDDLTLTVERRAIGRVIDETGQPVADAPVSLECAPDFVGGAYGRTKADGSFEIADVGVGRARLQVTLMEEMRPGGEPYRHCEGDRALVPITFNDLEVDFGTCRIRRGN
jgi:hypothetical protein